MCDRDGDGEGPGTQGATGTRSGLIHIREFRSNERVENRFLLYKIRTRRARTVYFGHWEQRTEALTPLGLVRQVS